MAEPFVARVLEAGGGRVLLLVRPDTDHYPEVGSEVVVKHHLSPDDKRPFRKKAKPKDHVHGHRPQDCDHYDAGHGSVCDLCCPSCSVAERKVP